MQNFVKTIINGVQKWTKKEIKKSTADWNQNDSSATDYVKNRTHWTEDRIVTTILPKFKCEDNILYAYEGMAGNISAPFVIDNHYTVIFDETVYDCVAYEFKNQVYLGNMLYQYDNIPINIQIPFLITSNFDSDGNWYTNYRTNEAGHTFEIIEIQEKIHKLDSKYLDIPTNLATTDDVQEVLNIANDKLTYINTRCTLPRSVKWSSITFGDGKFVAVAYDINKMTTNTAAYSTDGINWTLTNLPFSARWYSVTYGDGKFVAVCCGYDDAATAAAAYSTDGINWTKTTLPISAKWHSVTYGNGKFVAICNTLATDNYTHVVCSTDGINWTQTTLSISFDVANVTYGNGKFVAIFFDTFAAAAAAYSTDGINWTKTTLPISAKCSSITYGDGKFVAVSNGAFIYSTDGINWTKVSSPLLNYTCSVTFGNGKFVVVTNAYRNNYNTNTAAYSTDGINWTQTTLPISTTCSSITYGNGKFVTVSDGGYLNYGSKCTVYSTDGINWKYDPEALIQNQENKTSVIRNLLFPVPSSAQVGQTIVIKSVDENGQPNEWKTVELPSVDGLATEEFVNTSIANKVTVPQNAVMGDLLTYDGSNWVRISKADLISDILLAIEESNKITFYIKGEEYRADKNMTWHDWCNSNYNTSNFGNYYEGERVSDADDHIIYEDEFVYGSDIIIANYGYTVRFDPTTEV